MTLLRTRLRAAAVLALAPVALLPAACGGDETASSSAADNGESAKSATQIVKDATTALRGVHSYHVTGHLTNGGLPITLDIRFSGTNSAAGSMVSKGAHIDLVELNGQVFLHGSDLWNQVGGPALARLIGDRWVIFPAGDPSTTDIVRNFAAFGRADSLASLIESSAGSSPQKGGLSAVGGRPAIAVKAAATFVLDVATTGPPYPLRTTRSSGDTPGEIDLSDFNSSFDIRAPSNAVSQSALSQEAASSTASST